MGCELLTEAQSHGPEKLCSWRSLEFQKGLAQATLGYKQLLVIWGGWSLGPCHSVPPFLICEMGGVVTDHPLPGELWRTLCINRN